MSEPFTPPSVDAEKAMALANLLNERVVEALKSPAPRIADLEAVDPVESRVMQLMRLVVALVAEPQANALLDAMGVDPQEVYEALNNAAIELYFLHRDPDRATYERVFFENVIRRIDPNARALAIAYDLDAYAYVQPPPARIVHTPWGDLFPTREPPTSIVGASTAMVFALRQPAYAGGDMLPVAHSRLRRAVKVAPLLDLSFALAMPEGRRVIPQRLWSTTLDPLSTSGWGFSVEFRSTAPGGPSVVLTDEEADEIERWSAIVDKAPIQYIDVAVRRLVLAIKGREPRGDALIDAVTAWENLVGTQFEASYRVTMALAKLLESHPAKRLELFGRLREIYTTRSKLVHGTSGVNPKTIDADTNDAIAFAVGAIRVLAESRSDLLPMGSEKRANHILMVDP